MNPYRENPAPPIWNGCLARNQPHKVGSPTDLAIAADGRLVNTRTGECVRARSLRELVGADRRGDE